MEIKSFISILQGRNLLGRTNLKFQINIWNYQDSLWNSVDETLLRKLQLETILSLGSSLVFLSLSVFYVIIFHLTFPTEQ